MKHLIWTGAGGKWNTTPLFRDGKAESQITCGPLPVWPQLAFPGLQDLPRAVPLTGARWDLKPRLGCTLQVGSVFLILPKASVGLAEVLRLALALLTVRSS